MNYVYMVKCNDNTYYTGWTTNPKQRLKTHNLGKGAKYTRCRLPVTLIYLEQLPSKSIAMQREFTIKQLKRQEKDLLVSIYQKSIQGNPEFTPICWISRSKNDNFTKELPWVFTSEPNYIDSHSTVFVDISLYPVKKKENL